MSDEKNLDNESLEVVELSEDALDEASGGVMIYPFGAHACTVRRFRVHVLRARAPWAQVLRRLHEVPQRQRHRLPDLRTHPSETGGARRGKRLR